MGSEGLPNAGLPQGKEAALARGPRGPPLPHARAQNSVAVVATWHRLSVPHLPFLEPESGAGHAAAHPARDSPCARTPPLPGSRQSAGGVVTPRTFPELGVQYFPAHHGYRCYSHRLRGQEGHSVSDVPESTASLNTGDGPPPSPFFPRKGAPTEASAQRALSPTAALRGPRCSPAHSAPRLLLREI